MRTEEREGMAMPFISGHAVHYEHRIRRRTRSPLGTYAAERHATRVEAVKFVGFWACALLGLIAIEAGVLYFLSAFR
jgi:hypothetical protein